MTSLPGGWLESGHGSIAIYVKDFRDPLERKKKLILRPWASIKDIKDQLQVLFNVPTHVQKLYYQGRELQNIHNLPQCGIYQDHIVLDFVARRTDRISRQYETSENTLADIHPYGTCLLPISIMKIMHQSLQGLALGLVPILAMDGTGGTYFFKDPNHRIVGCFKPQDEEPFGPNNPREFIGTLGQSGLRRGILSGEACEREVAAYVFDRDHFANVPATSMVQARHPVFKYTTTPTNDFKIGSFQEFIRHDDVASDLAPSLFPLHQVHKIVLLDMRLLNTDRNDANILVRKRRLTTSYEYELIPIDHGYCLPHVLEIAWCDWCWYHWPQLRQPLSESDRNYLLAMDPQQQVLDLIKTIPLRSACRRNMLIANMLVYKGVEANLLLYDIAKIMCREELDTPSMLEMMCLEAFHQVQVQTPKKKSFFSNGKTLSIDTTLYSSTSPRYSPRTLNGARSPPGFWASYTPFTEEEESPREWNNIASHVLEQAVVFNENDKDEFEILNEYLDTNGQYEKQFFHILGRLMDEKIILY